MKNIKNYILESVNSKFKNYDLDDIANAIYSVFQEWEEDADSWDPPFNTQDVVKDCKSIVKLFDKYKFAYFNPWNDLYSELNIGDNDQDKFQKFCRDNDDEILEILKKMC